VESISVEPEPAGHPPSFADYRLYEPPSPSARPPLDLTSHRDAGRFRTALAEGVARGPNFAGDLTVVSWRCGTACEEGLVVDLRSGRIVGHVEAVLGFEFRTDSRLLILNPPSRPCCGATPEEMPPVRRFEFTVRRVGYAYRVETLPVYVP
jgi:hypothetical protein